ncbi:AraC family transcriptional regulator [Rhizobium bangladeshense]|uniref:AraC family transcriptional regulator n=1 Tax=Rhizobium bangladeshense TaxID=1138189 RepID=UPI0007E595A1|nr:AraC family transcriptional regulator [Rhizobium bangladeshense]
MLDRSSNASLFGGSDAVSDLLRGLRLDGVDYGRCEMGAPWGISFPAQTAARFHFIDGSSCWLKVSAGDWLELRAGDAVLLPRGREHVLASAPDVPSLAIRSFSFEEVSQGIYEMRGGNAEATTTLFCGSMHFNVGVVHPLLRMMPETMRATELAGRDPAIPHLLEAMTREVDMKRVGSAGILARLADVLAATIIRAWVERGCGDSTGWVAAIRNSDIGKVLAAIHRSPDHDWTVESLAKLMGASRSSFAERFTAIVGETPARYVTRVRMHHAMHWLTRDRLRVSVVATRLGYDSQASFSRAFKRVIGEPPSHFRDDAQGEGLFSSPLF